MTDTVTTSSAIESLSAPNIVTSAPLIPRIDFAAIFSVENGNANGDADANNAPRRNPNNGLGIVTDVCLKRKVRNRIQEMTTYGALGEGYEIFIRQGSVLSETKGDAAKMAKENGTDLLTELTRRYADIRMFGGVLSANKNAEVAAPSLTGPIQFGFAQSIGRIMPVEHSITRCAVENKKDGPNQTMGNKHTVPFTLYRVFGHINPYHAQKSGLTEQDVEVFRAALLSMFESDRSAARGEMAVRAAYAFEHASPLGTPGVQAVELLEMIRIKALAGDSASGMDDFKIEVDHIAPFLQESGLAEKGLSFHRWKEPLVAGNAFEGFPKAA